MTLTRRRLRAVLIALSFATTVVATPARAFYVISTCQACTGSGAGECETAPSVEGAGQTASMSRAWDSDGFHYATDTNMRLDYVSLAAFARASGLDNPDTGTTFLNSVTRIARSIGHIDDVLTAGEGGVPGFFRIPLHVTGATAISWQNGGGSAALVFQCVSSIPGGALAIGHCPLTQFDFTGNETLDTIVNLDVPIVLGQPFEYRITVSIQATTGHGYGDLIPFQGAAQASFASGPFAGAAVLDASRAVIAGAPISASESGFQYVPEPGAALAGATALALLATRRRSCAARGRPTR